MDIDISDILADVSRIPGSSYNVGRSYDLAGAAYTDHQQLVRAWTAERSSPSLLPYPLALVNRILTRIREQIARIEDMTSTMGSSDTYTTIGGGTTTMTSKRNHNQNTNLILSILQTDLSRTQFILRSYLRQRLTKITKHATYWLKHVDDHDVHASGTDNDNMPPPHSDHHSLLSPSESAFLRNHQALLSTFYDSSFLASFPANLRRLDDSAGGVNMVEGPDGGAGVVVRCLAGEWDNVGDLDDQDVPFENERADVELRMRRDEVWVVRWRDVRQGVVKGDLELL